MKIDIFPMIVCLMLLLLSAGMYYQTNKLTENILSLTEYTLSHKYLYEEVIQRFAEVHSYNKTEYNCVNYSEDLGVVLESLGYKTTQIRMIPQENNTFHRRLQLNLEIEPEQAEVIIGK